MRPARLTSFPNSYPLSSSYLCQLCFQRTFSSTIQRPKDGSNTSPTASDKLFADAAREEAEEALTSRESSRITFLEKQHENWTGEERMEDAVLRMLVDKYKPLRSGTIMTAEQKLKRTPPQIHLDVLPLSATASQQSLMDNAPTGSISETTRTITAPTTTGSWATEPLLPSTDGHRPWHTTYRAPSHATASVKLAHFLNPLTHSPPSTLPPPIDERARKKEKENKKRTQHASRLTRAKESTLDYRLGIKSTSTTTRPQGDRPNPVSLKGWTSLIEDKIEKARMAGLFNTVKGRGKPLARNHEEFNPFIGREEFLMNRIVQRNGAAPPWVEFQGELDLAVANFREMLRQSWIRRAIRTLTIDHPASVLAKLTLQDIQTMRDTEWEERERSYHETAMAEVNSLVRRYNGQAPYAVRRPYYIRSVEVEKIYAECGEDILRELSERSQARGQLGLKGKGMQSRSSVPQHGHMDFGLSLRIRDVIRIWFEELMKRWRWR